MYSNKYISQLPERKVEYRQFEGSNTIITRMYTFLANVDGAQR